MNNKKQKGATLMVALIMLTILTLLGVSNMNSSTISLKLASNFQASHNSFQAAFSGIQQVLDSQGGDINFDQVTGTQSVIYTYGNASTGQSSVTVTVTPVTGGSVSAGLSLSGNGGSIQHFTIRSSSSFGTSSSSQVQGVYKRVAGTN